MKLYKSVSGIVHLTEAGYICIKSIGKVIPNLEGNSVDVTCKNCKFKMRMYD